MDSLGNEQLTSLNDAYTSTSCRKVEWTTTKFVILVNQGVKGISGAYGSQMAMPAGRQNVRFPVSISATGPSPLVEREMRDRILEWFVATGDVIPWEQDPRFDPKLVEALRKGQEEASA